MATLQEIKTKVDSKLSDFWPKLVAKQDAYFAKHGKYFQKLITSPVVDGVDTDYVAIEPSDEKHSADADFTYANQLPFQVSIDEWMLGDTAGWSATIRVELFNGDIYTRKRNNLNEDSGWSKYLEPKNVY
jgi:hypothetical protein